MRPCYVLIFLVLCPIMAVHAQDLDWVYTYTGSQFFEANGIAIDSIQNTVIVGHFQQTFDFDPGPGVLNLTSTGGQDGFVQKLDSGGNLIWVKSFTADRVQEIEIDAWGNIYLSGSNQSPGADFDPGPGIFTLPISQQYVAKWDSNGNFIWAVGYAPGTNLNHFLELDPIGGVYVGGNLNASSADFDPGSGVHQITRVGSGNDLDAYILKLDTAGSFVWVDAIGSVTSESVSGVESDRFGNVFLVGQFSGTLDFDPGSGTMMMAPGGSTFPNGYAMKLDFGGNLVWAKGFVGTGRCLPNCVRVDDVGSAYIGGEFAELIDFDPGSSQATLNSPYSVSYVDGFMAKLDNIGQFVWTKRWTGPQYESMDQIDFFENGDLLVAARAYSGADIDPGAGVFLLPGVNLPSMFFSRLDVDGDFLWGKYFQSTTSWIGANEVAAGGDTSVFAAGHWGSNVDFDPSPSTYQLAGNTGTYNHYWGRWTPSGCNSLVCEFDSVSDITCSGGTGYVSVAVSGGAAPYSYQWTGQAPGTVSSLSSGVPGIYEVIVRDSNLCSQNRQVLIDGPTFPLGFDLRADLFAGGFRPGFVGNVSIDAQNQGCSSISSQLQLIFDGQALTFQGANPMPSSVSGDTLTWQLPALTSDSVHPILGVSFGVGTMVPIHSWLCFDLSINPTSGDLDTSNNHQNHCYMVVSGIDPNAKEVYPQGKCQPKYVEFADSSLIYTIHFQNTGNADAINVVVLDTIDDHLDLNSTCVVGSSHHMVTEVLPGSVLRFRFDNIHLPDSNTNEPLSHGYLIYEIRPESGLPSGTVVRNGSAIYFDYNAPVITNEVMNTLVDSIPSTMPLVANHFVCPGDSFLFPNGSVIYGIQSNMSQSSSFISSEGCDSIVVTNLILGNSQGQMTISVCDSYTSPSGMNIWTSSGTYLDTIPNAIGCDSVIVVNLTISIPDTAVMVFQDSLLALTANGLLQWLDCDSAFNAIPGATTHSFVPFQNGFYALEVNVNGCVDTSRCYPIVVVGIKDVHSLSPKVFPNPSVGSFRIDLGVEVPDGTFELSDCQGSLIMRSLILNQREIEVAQNLPKGAYFVKVMIPNNHIYRGKVVLY